MLRARRAASVTRLNLESTRSSSSSIGGVIIPLGGPFLLGPAGREHEDQAGVGPDGLDLAGAVDLDLEHDDVGARAGLGRRRAVVVAQEVGPLEEAAGGDARFERLAS